MSTILGILSCATLGIAVYLSYLHQGQSVKQYGEAALIAVLFMTIGLLLGIWSTTEKETFKLFAVLGILFNTLAFGMLSLILYAGAYVG